MHRKKDSLEQRHLKVRPKDKEKHLIQKSIRSHSQLGQGNAGARAQAEADTNCNECDIGQQCNSGKLQSGRV